MENIGQKKKPCEEKKNSRQKWLRKMHLKNVVITYKNRILKFKIRVSQKKSFFEIELPRGKK